MNDKTLRNQLPYDFQPLPQPGRVKIVNTRGQSLIVSRDEIKRQLDRKDLDVHRRRMYEGAIAALDKAGTK